MTPRRPKARRAASPARRTPTYRPSGDTFLIVTEGEKTEPNYLKALCGSLGIKAADVNIDHPRGTDPITLTKHAIMLRDERKRTARRDKGAAYDHVWVVFDLEKPHSDRRRQAKDAKNLKGVSEIKFAISDPCFEFWFLLHETYTDRDL